MLGPKRIHVPVYFHGKRLLTSLPGIHTELQYFREESLSSITKASGDGAVTSRRTRGAFFYCGRSCKSTGDSIHQLSKIESASEDLHCISITHSCMTSNHTTQGREMENKTFPMGVWRRGSITQRRLTCFSQQLRRRYVGKGCPLPLFFYFSQQFVVLPKSPTVVPERRH